MGCTQIRHRTRWGLSTLWIGAGQVVVIATLAAALYVRRGGGGSDPLS
jgi:crotonobetainyl-CoA:carnitine CoA-transferase CaiB-like acyl-CoA transferase